MANSGNREWDFYETWQKRDFVYRPASAIPDLRPQTSRAHRNTYALAGPIGRSAYRDDFGWKSQSKPVWIRTGSATGDKRNNPQPSQFFMTWKIFPGMKICDTLPSVEEVHHAEASQYTSTYRTDFLRHHPATKMVKPKPSPDSSQPMQTEMKQNFHKPVQKAELLQTLFYCGTSDGQGGPLKGIVPTVVQKHITNQENWKPVSTYKRYFGGKSTDRSSLIRFLPTAELQILYNNLPENEGTPAMQSRSSVPPDQKTKCSQ